MDAAKFMTNVVPVPESGCWLWQGAANMKGYGTLYINGVRKMAHRYSYELFRGPIGEGLFACHKCDTPACCNPDHLFLGTNRDNTQDMFRKGRSARQRKTHCPKGHEYTPENTRVKKNGQRSCRRCHFEHNIDYLNRNSVEASVAKIIAAMGKRRAARNDYQGRPRTAKPLARSGECGEEA